MDLIDRHFDQELTPHERGDLRWKLLSEPDCAIEFARAARLDESLESHFNEMVSEGEIAGLVRQISDAPIPMRNSRPLRIGAAAAALVALTFGIFALWPDTSQTEEKPESAGGTGSPKTRVERSRITLTGAPLTAILPKPKQETDPEVERRLRQRLSQFYLPETSIRNLPLDEALEVLQQEFYQLDELGWTSEEEVEFKLDERSVDPPRVTLTRTDISVMSALNLLAMQSGCEVSFTPPKVRLIPESGRPESADGGKFYTRTFSVPHERLAGGPFQEMGVESLGERPQSFDATALLRRQWQLDLSHPDASAFANSEKSQLILRASLREHERLGALLAEANGSSEASSPVTVRTQIISVPDELGHGQDRILGPDEWQLLYNHWHLHPEVKIASGPSMTMGVGDRAESQIMITTKFVEIAQDHGPVKDGTPPEISVRRAFTGEGGWLRIPVTANVSGEQITLTGQVDQGFHEDEIHAALLEEMGGSDPDSPTVQFITNFEAPLYPGQVAVFECQCPETGRKRVAAISVRWGSFNAPLRPGIIIEE